jgi:hypothetical protein
MLTDETREAHDFVELTHARLEETLGSEPGWKKTAEGNYILEISRGVGEEPATLIVYPEVSAEHPIRATLSFGSTGNKFEVFGMDGNDVFGGLAERLMKMNLAPKTESEHIPVMR